MGAWNLTHWPDTARHTFEPARVREKETIMGRIYLTPVSIWSKRLRRRYRNELRDHKAYLRAGPPYDDARNQAPATPGSKLRKRMQGIVFDQYQRELKESHRGN